MVELDLGGQMLGESPVPWEEIVEAHHSPRWQTARAEVAVVDLETGTAEPVTIVASTSGLAAETPDGAVRLEQVAELTTTAGLGSVTSTLTAHEYMGGAGDAQPTSMLTVEVTANEAAVGKSTSQVTVEGSVVGYTRAVQPPALIEGVIGPTGEIAELRVTPDYTAAQIDAGHNGTAPTLSPTYQQDALRAVGLAPVEQGIISSPPTILATMRRIISQFNRPTEGREVRTFGQMLTTPSRRSPMGRGQMV